MHYISCYVKNIFRCCVPKQRRKTYTVSTLFMISLSESTHDNVSPQLNSTVRRVVPSLCEGPNHLIPWSRIPEIWVQFDSREGCFARCLLIFPKNQLLLLLVRCRRALWKCAQGGGHGRGGHGTKGRSRMRGLLRGRLTLLTGYAAAAGRSLVLAFSWHAFCVRKWAFQPREKGIGE